MGQYANSTRKPSVSIRMRPPSATLRMTCRTPVAPEAILRSLSVGEHGSALGPIASAPHSGLPLTDAMTYHAHAHACTHVRTRIYSSPRAVLSTSYLASLTLPADSDAADSDLDSDLDLGSFAPSKASGSGSGSSPSFEASKVSIRTRVLSSGVHASPKTSQVQSIRADFSGVRLFISRQRQHAAPVRTWPQVMGSSLQTPGSVSSACGSPTSKSATCNGLQVFCLLCIVSRSRPPRQPPVTSHHRPVSPTKS